MLGYYNPKSSTIYIDMEHLLQSGSEECLQSILHECFHVSQYQYTEIYKSLSEVDRNSYFFRDAAIYVEEFDNYANGTDNFIRYYSQKV